MLICKLILGLLSIPLYAEQLFVLVDQYKLEIPIISAEDISDRSKADIFTKAFAICQSTWLVLHCVTRAVIGLRE